MSLKQIASIGFVVGFLVVWTAPTPAIHLTRFSDAQCLAQSFVYVWNDMWRRAPASYLRSKIDTDRLCAV
jgi:hypothetical protein